MKQFILTPRREKELKIIEWFIPDNCDWNNRKVIFLDNYIGISDIEENPNGITAEEAFFMRSERGKFPVNCKNKARLRAILWGKTWRERHLSEVWDKSCMFPQDFLDEPAYIREFVLAKFFNLPKDWKPENGLPVSREPV